MTVQERIRMIRLMDKLIDNPELGKKLIENYDEIANGGSKKEEDD